MTKSSQSKKVSKSNKPVLSDRDERVADVHPTGGAPRGWDTTRGRKWVVVAFWGEETTTTFYRDEAEAVEAYEEATINGADAFCAKTSRMMMQSDPIGDERTR